MRLLTLIITILTINISAFSNDVKRVYLRSLSTDKTVESVAVYSDNEFYGYSNNRGVIELKGLSDSSVLIFTHPGYITVQVKCDSLPKKAVIKLKQSSNSIKEIEVVAHNTFERVLRTILSVVKGRSITRPDETIYTYIPHECNRYIKTIKYRLVDYKGMKDVKYLPFKANIYSVDTVSKLPLKAILKDSLIKKRDNKLWVKMDVSSYKIKVPKEGLFIAFITLEHIFYGSEWIKTKRGSVKKSPAIGSIIRRFGQKKYSVSSNNIKDRPKRVGDYYYMMELEYCDE
jgi:hypothetical protein